MLRPWRKIGYDVFFHIAPHRRILWTFNRKFHRVRSRTTKTQPSMDTKLRPLGNWNSTNSRTHLAATLQTVVPIRSIKYELGRWKSDYPRKLAIECFSMIRRWYRFLNQQHSRQCLFSRRKRPPDLFPSLRCKRILFTEQGEDKIFDWSIAELKFYQ